MIKQAILGSMKLHNKTSMKILLKQMMRHLNDSFEFKTYSKQSFRGFILSCLRPARLAKYLTKCDEIGEAYLDRAAKETEFYIKDLEKMVGTGAAP